ncbi:carboxypeptidase-like regulatory domain-containing protein [Gemmatimonadota bacterium]
MNSLSMIGSFRLWAMKSKASAVIFLVLLASSVVFLGCKNSGTEPVPTYNVQGHVRDVLNNGIEGVSLLLSGENLSETETSDSSGNYIFTGVEPGVYILYPSNHDHYFSPDSQQVIVFTTDLTVKDFAALRYPYLIVSNEGTKTIVGVELNGCYSTQENIGEWTENLLSKEVQPGSDSDPIRMPGSGCYTVMMNYPLNDSILSYIMVEEGFAWGDTLIVPFDERK